MLIVPMIGVLIMHDVLQNYVTMKVIVITKLRWSCKGVEKPFDCVVGKGAAVDDIHEVWHRVTRVEGSQTTTILCRPIFISFSQARV